MDDLPERGTPEYLEQLEHKLVLTAAVLGLVVAAPEPIELADVAERCIEILNDVAPWLEAIHDTRNEATSERLAAELQAIDRAGLTHVAVATQISLEREKRRRRLG